MLGAPELLIILIIIIVLFGVGRLTKIGSDLARAMREFRAGLKEKEEEKKEETKK
jgi:sec-independent protein translocase protein TatA